MPSTTKLHAKRTTMKLNINIPENSRLIARYLANEMSNSERVYFENMVNANKENKHLITTMKKDWEQLGPLPQHQPNINKAWGNLFDKLESENLISQTRTATRFVWAKIAATVVLLIAIGSLLFMPSFWSTKVTVETGGQGATLVHTLPDGSFAYLGKNSSITYSKRFGKKSRELSLKGEAFFDVTKNQNLPFVIDVAGAEVRVLGTSFSVKAESKEQVEVVVETGRVNVTPKAKSLKAVIAEAGEKITISNTSIQKSLIVPTEMHSEKAKRLQFKDESLQAVVEAINKTYHANIVIDKRNAKQRRLTVTFENNSVPYIVDIISKTLKLETTFVDSTIILSEPNK